MKSNFEFFLIIGIILTTFCINTCVFHIAENHCKKTPQMTQLGLSFTEGGYRQVKHFKLFFGSSGIEPKSLYLLGKSSGTGAISPGSPFIVIQGLINFAQVVLELSIFLPLLLQ
jgi:hypothetical protein